MLFHALAVDPHTKAQCQGPAEEIESPGSSSGPRHSPSSRTPETANGSPVHHVLIHVTTPTAAPSQQASKGGLRAERESLPPTPGGRSPRGFFWKQWGAAEPEPRSSCPWSMRSPSRFSRVCSRFSPPKPSASVPRRGADFLPMSESLWRLFKASRWASWPGGSTNAGSPRYLCPSPPFLWRSTLLPLSFPRSWRHSSPSASEPECPAQCSERF